MSHSDVESSSESVQNDEMSVSDQEVDASREDDMPSAELNVESEDVSNKDEDNSSQTGSSLSMEDVQNKTVVTNDLTVTPVSSSSSIIKCFLFQIPYPIFYQMDLMLASYSEIVPSRFKIETVSEEVCDPPIKNMVMDGTLLKDGDMVHFVARNLETKIKLSSPEVAG